MIAVLVLIVGVCAGFTVGACYEHLRRGGTVDRLVEKAAPRSVTPDEETARQAEINRGLDALLAPLPPRQDIR